MARERFLGPDGSLVIICTREQRAKPCKSCGRPSTKLCDYPLQGRKAGATCSVPMCDRCATTVGSAGGDTVDYCRVHAEMKRGGRAMRPLGIRKLHTAVAVHQHCGVCHPRQRSGRARARRLALRLERLQETVSAPEWVLGIVGKTSRRGK